MYRFYMCVCLFWNCMCCVCVWHHLSTIIQSLAFSVVSASKLCLVGTTVVDQNFPVDSLTVLFKIIGKIKVNDNFYSKL